MSSWLSWESWLTAEGRTWPFEFLPQGFQKERKNVNKEGNNSWILFTAKLSGSLVPRSSAQSSSPRRHFLSISTPVELILLKVYIWRSRWFSKHLPTDIFKILASFLMSKVFFPIALLFVRVPVPLPVLFCLGCWEASERQGKYSPGRGRRGQGAKKAWGAWIGEKIDSGDLEEKIKVEGEIK